MSASTATAGPSVVDAPATTQPANTKSSSRPRTRYSEEQRRVVALRYPTCRSQAEKLALCEEVGISDIRRLYNLACQMGLTRSSDDLSDKEFHEYMAGNRGIMTQRRRHNPQDERTLLEQREDPRTCAFSAEDDKFIIANFGRLAISAIAIQRGHTESAILYRARHLKRQRRNADGEMLAQEPLRRPAVGFLLHQVLAWLGLSDSEAAALEAAGVEIRPLPNKKAEVQGEWVLARSLAPFLRKYGARLIQEKDADRFFIKEILETEEILTRTDSDHPELAAAREQLEAVEAARERGEPAADEDAVDAATAELEDLIGPHKEAGAVQESCYFLDHGHKCQNPWAGPCYRLFCDGEDEKCLVQDMHKDIRFGGEGSSLIVL